MQSKNFQGLWNFQRPCLAEFASIKRLWFLHR